MTTPSARQSRIASKSSGGTLPAKLRSGSDLIALFRTGQRKTAILDDSVQGVDRSGSIVDGGHGWYNMSVMAKMRRKTRRPLRNKEGGAYQVFVSHATADKWLAKTLCEKIEQTGVTTFRDDRDIDGGDDIPDRIRREIKSSNEMVVLLTPESIGRAWVLLEVGAAWATRARYRIVAVLCHVTVDTIPGMLASKKAVPLNSFDDYLKELKVRVRRLKR